MSQSLFPIIQYTYPDGNPLANGIVKIRISKDTNYTLNDLNYTAEGQLVSNDFIFINLDSNGFLSQTIAFFANSELTPNDSCYIIWAFSEQGRLILGPYKVIVPSGSINYGFGLAFGSNNGS